MLPKAEIKDKNQLERWVIRIMKAIIIGTTVYMVLGLFAMAQTACTQRDKYPYGMTSNQAKVEAARITQSPTGECWGGDGAWQCLSKNGVWTTCFEACQVILFANDVEYWRRIK